MDKVLSGHSGGERVVSSLDGATIRTILTIDIQNAEHLVKEVLAAVKETQR